MKENDHMRFDLQYMDGIKISLSNLHMYTEELNSEVLKTALAGLNGKYQDPSD